MPTHESLAAFLRQREKLAATRRTALRRALTAFHRHHDGQTEPHAPVRPPLRPRLSADEFLAAKETQPIWSLDDLAADTFGSDEELEEFLAFTRAERQRDLA